MAEGDTFLGFLKDAVNSVPGIGTSARLAWGQGNYDPAAGNGSLLSDADASAMERVASVVNAVPGLSQIGEATTWAGDHFAPLKFVLDFGNRTADSFFTGGQAEDDDDENTTFFDGWRQGWDSWGTDEHLSAGQIVGANINNGFQATGLSPFTKQGVSETQTLARSTWYGDVAGATTDIAAGFLTPGTGALKAARLGKVVSTVGEAEDVTRAFNAGERAGKTGSFFKPQSPQVQATRLEQLAKVTFDRAESYNDVVNFLGPLTSSMSGRGQRLLADVAVTARRTFAPTEAQHVIGNAYLASMGSDAARLELMNNYPLVASKLANGQLSPQIFADQAKAAEMMHQQWMSGPENVDLNKIIADVHGTPRKVAEQKALTEAVSRSTEEAKKLKDLKVALKEDAKAVREIYPGLNATHAWLADLDAMGRADTVLPTLKLKPSALDRMKTAIRDEVGGAHLFNSGDFNRRMFFHVMPKSWLANIGTAYGRSAINTLDRYVGAQELGMYLKKSEVYSGDEIKAITEKFHQLQPGQTASWVNNLHERMLDRIFADVAPHLSESDRADAIGGVMAGMGQHRQYLTKAADDADAAGSRWAQIHEFPDELSSDAIHNVDAAFLRSHIAETAPFADPVMLRQSIKHYDSKGSITREAFNASVRGVDYVVGGWKIAQILRPGMAVRNALDSNVRAYALMGTIPSMVQAMKGTKHLLKNTGMRVGDWTTVRKAKVPALQKIGAQDPSGVVRQMLNEVELPSGQKVSLHGVTDDGGVDVVQLAMNRTAMNKGSSPAKGILSMGDRAGAKFSNNSESWKHYRADDKEWARAYADHAKVLLASPTARKVIESELFDGTAQVTMAQVRREFFADPAVRGEFAKLRDTHDMTQDEFLAQVIRETDIMFPEPGMAQDLLAGKFHGASGKKWIESHFPKDQRFDVPGEESVYHGGKGFVRDVLNKTFNVLQDEPDFILARHPVAFNAFQKQVKAEAQALYDARTSRYGDRAEFTDSDLKKIEARARAHAISTVRDYMYDATRQTGVSATATLNRLIPFFAPFQDTMRAYSRLIYDDPGRLFKMAGLYNAPFNASMHTSNPFIVDEYGNEVSRSQRDTAGETFMLINGQWGTNKVTGRRQASGGFALRASSFNTILQGEVPWLPGWGPAVQIPVQLGLNSNDKAALYLTQSDNPAIKTLMASLFQDGEIPASDPSSLAKSLIPSWLRRLGDSTGGVAYGRNVGYLMNQKFMEAQARGVPFDQARALEESKREAQSAGVLQAITQFGFGISGDAQVQGKFYVQKMHEYQALATPTGDGSPSMLEQLYGSDDPAAVFAQQFPEAKDLRWSFTRNETGISATATAQNAAIDLKGLIDQNAEMGWFIVGADNVGGDFSQTAYNQQKQDTYGFGKGRKQLDAGEIQQGVRVSQGWAEFTKYTTDLSNLSVAQGLDPKTVSIARKSIIAAIGQENPDWYAEYNNRTNKVQDFYQRADLLADDPRLAKRQDIAMYATYRQAQQQVLDAFGLNSFAGTSANSESAKWAMYQIGTQMARQNIGFQQMWERVLSTDVEPSEKQKVGSDVG